MTREIKFRAWNKIARRMSEPFNLYSLTDGYFTNKKGTIDAMTFVLSECDVIQFTGLKDKNDKEIYEGDILKVPEEYGEDKVIVSWYVSSGAWGLKGCEMFLYDLTNDREVIGNIHENPELLKDGPHN